MNGYEPRSFDQYPGQERVKAQLLPSLAAAKQGKGMPHILFNGPAGVGKTTLANIIAAELGTNCVTIAARNLNKLSQFLDIVMKLEHNDVLFIDEIHGLSIAIEEQLYDVVDRFGFWHTINGKAHWIPVKHFVLIGATTAMGELSAPLLSRFGIICKLEWYDEDTLADMAVLTAAKMGNLLTEEAAEMIAKSSRGVARKMTKLLDRADDLSRVAHTHLIDEAVVGQVLKVEGIDDEGLDETDRHLIHTMAKLFPHQPVGLSTLAAVLGEQEDTLANVVEPFLLRKGFVVRTPRGRMLTTRGMEIANAA